MIYPGNPSEKATEIIRRFERRKAQRGTLEAHLQEIKDLVRPNATDFTRGTSKGSKRAQKIYDGTAMDANNKLAGAFHSYLTSPVDRWFNFSLDDIRIVDANEGVREWLEIVSDTIYHVYGIPESGFTTAVHEAYLDLCSFGTCVIFQDWDWEKMSPYFLAIALATCYFEENSKHQIDLCDRETIFTGRQAKQEFGQENLHPDMLKQENLDKEFVFVHSVYPRGERDITKAGDPMNMAFASCWVDAKNKKIVSESGYETFPYHVGRFEKIAEETYGRSPAMNCLPDIKMLQAMSRVIIRSAQKVTDPPLMVENDGVILPIATGESSLIFLEPGAKEPKPLVSGAQPQIGHDLMEQRRQHIRSVYFLDWVIAQRKKERQSATEIMDDRDEDFRMMGPMLGRLQQEFLGPMLSRTYNLLNKHAMIPQAPMEAQGQKGRIVYVSQASTAQMGNKVNSIRQVITDLSMLQPIAPDVMDVLETDEMGRDITKLRNLPVKYTRTPEKIQARRQQRQEMEQAAAAAKIGLDASSGMKNMAEAQKTLSGVTGGA